MNDVRMTMNDAMDEVFNRRRRPIDLCDSDRNIMADLAGEADEPCADINCDEMVRPMPISPTRDEFEFMNDDGEPLCEECAVPLSFDVCVATPFGPHVLATNFASAIAAERLAADERPNRTALVFVRETPKEGTAR